MIQHSQGYISKLAIKEQAKRNLKPRNLMQGCKPKTWW